jgi:hypothetical protein
VRRLRILLELADVELLTLAAVPERRRTWLNDLLWEPIAHTVASLDEDILRLVGVDAEEPAVAHAKIREWVGWGMAAMTGQPRGIDRVYTTLENRSFVVPMLYAHEFTKEQIAAFDQVEREAKAYMKRLHESVIVEPLEFVEGFRRKGEL